MYYRLEIRLKDLPGTFGEVGTAIGEMGGNLSLICTKELIPKKTIVRELTVEVRDGDHAIEIKRAIEKMENVEVLSVSVLDDILSYHRGGKIGTMVTVPAFSKEDLSKIYTPGVGEVSKLICRDKKYARTHTNIGNTVLIASDGSAVLGLGNVGPLAFEPVAEGKAAFLMMFGGLYAWRELISTQKTKEIIATIKNISLGYAAILLEDFSAPRCFKIEMALQEALDIPVIHDDQHQTAIVVLAALINAAKIVGKELKNLKIVISGAGASGTATAKTLRYMGIENIICSDSAGIIYLGRKKRMNSAKRWLAENTNPDRIKGLIGKALAGADAFVGLSKPGAVSIEDFKDTAQDFIFLPLANPVPELWPDQVSSAVTGTGRCDLPNQVNNALAFPGFFRGLIDAGSPKLTGERLEKIKIQVAQALAGIITPQQLNKNYLLPSLSDPQLHRMVAKTTKEAVWQLAKAVE